MAAEGGVSGEAGFIPLDLNLNHAFENLGAATSSASSSAPVTFSTGAKQVLSGSSSASDTMSGLLKIGLSIAALSALFYFLKGRK